MNGYLLVSGSAAHNAYGPFQNIVDLIGWAIGAAGALIALALAPKGWNPMRGGVLEVLSVLVIAAGLLLVGKAPTALLYALVAVGLVVAVGCGLKYSGLLGELRFDIETTPDPKGRVKKLCWIRGDDLTDEAKAKQPEPLEEIAKDAGYNPNRVWTPKSRNRNRHRLELWYLPTVIGGAVALVSAATLFH